MYIYVCYVNLLIAVFFLRCVMCPLVDIRNYNKLKAEAVLVRIHPLSCLACVVSVAGIVWLGIDTPTGIIVVS